MADLEKQKPLVVEFIGLGGAGKTTISRQLAMNLSSHGLQCLERQHVMEMQPKTKMRKFLRAIQCGVINGDLAKALIGRSFTFSPNKRKLLLNIYRTLIHQDLLKRTVANEKCDIIVFEQWLFQGIAWLISEPYGVHQKKALYDITTRLLQENCRMAIVLVDVPKVATLERIKKRGEDYDSSVIAMEQKDALSHIHGGFERLLTMSDAVRSMDVAMLTVDGLADPAYNADIITEWLLGLHSKCLMNRARG